MAIVPSMQSHVQANSLKKLHDPVSGELMTKAVTLIPCGHILNEETVLKCLLHDKLCPVDKQLIEKYTPNYTTRILLESSVLPSPSKDRYINLFISLLDEPQIRGNFNLNVILEDLISELMSQKTSGLTSEQEELCRWAEKLLIEDGKVSLYVARKLAHLHAKL